MYHNQKLQYYNINTQRLVVINLIKKEKTNIFKYRINVAPNFCGTIFVNFVIKGIVQRYNLRAIFSKLVSHVM